MTQRHAPEMRRKQVAEVFVILDHAYDRANYFFHVQKITLISIRRIELWIQVDMDCIASFEG